ncbi:hypothetical protein UlMin_040014 [Ulmus minor]
MDSQMVAKGFVQHHYCTFDSNRAGLGWIDAELRGLDDPGAQNIIDMLTSLPFPSYQHHIRTVDCQPFVPTGGFLVFFCGTLHLAGVQHALKFGQFDIFRQFDFHFQMLHLMPAWERFYVLNDIFS